MKTSEISLTTLIVFVVLCAAQTGKAGNGLIKGDRPEIVYETDAHYWTVLVVATLLKMPEAKAMAFSAEYPDNVINSDGYCVRNRHTFMYPKAQKKIHALTGGNPEYERALSVNMLVEARTAVQKGVAAHRLGDSFAHTNDKTGRMYPHLIGHTLHWKEPDKIKHNPDKYLLYVHALITALGGPDAQIDMSVFNYIANAGLNTDTNSAILKAEYKLLTDSPAFNIDKNQTTEVETYLNERLANESLSFITHAETNAKGSVTITVILTAFVTGDKLKLLTSRMPGYLKKGASNVSMPGSSILSTLPDTFLSSDE